MWYIFFIFSFPLYERGLLFSPFKGILQLFALCMCTFKLFFRNLNLFPLMDFDKRAMHYNYFAELLYTFWIWKVSSASSNAVVETKRNSSKMEPKAQFQNAPKKSRLEARSSCPPFKVNCSSNELHKKLLIAFNCCKDYALWNLILIHWQLRWERRNWEIELQHFNS